jgi:hypothetical protein
VHGEHVTLVVAMTDVQTARLSAGAVTLDRFHTDVFDDGHKSYPYLV